MAATANAAPLPRKAPTTLSIRESAAPGRGHGKEVITGTLKQGRKSLAGQSVTLDIVSGRRLVPAGTEHTSRAGAVSFTVSPKRTTRYELVFGGTRTLAGSHSGTVTVLVR
ncbi:MAG TPA: hypothetical protein VHF26_09850 [Trebonia sp.]|nr:hypothetical protein [Trebonia sp.]